MYWMCKPSDFRKDQGLMVLELLQLCNELLYPGLGRCVNHVEILIKLKSPEMDSSL